MKGRPRRVADGERCQAMTEGRWYGAPSRCPYRAVSGSDPRLCNVHRKVYERGTRVFLCDNRTVQRSPVRQEGA
jgi:hypothetical protein